jgi:hypothetical protein
MIQWGLKGVNAEKSDLEALRSKLSNLLLGEKAVKPETTIPKEIQEATAPASPTLPEPPVVVHVRNPNKQSS